jgi:hypothetical protein
MLNEALLVAHRHSELQRKEAEFIEDLKKLPLAELKEVVKTGQIKLAYGGPDFSDGNQVSWLNTFKGTPFFEQAIALEQEDLQAQMASQQSNSVEQQQSQQRWALLDQIRLKKRLLEIQKARNEAQVLSGGGGPPSQTGSAPGADAQGAGALGPVAPEGQQEGSGDAHKLGSVKKAFAVTDEGHKFDSEYYGMKARHAAEEMGLLQAYGAMGSASRMGSLGRSLRFGAPTEDPRHLEYAAAKHREGKNAWNPLGGAITPSSHESNGSTLQYGEHAPPKEHKTKKAAVEGADAWGRELARRDMAKVARAKELLETGDALGRSIAKSAGVLGQVGEWALKHPGQAGAAAGGIAGAAHGLLRENGGVGEALTEGAVGAGLGHAAGSIGSAVHGGATMGDAVKGYGSKLKSEATKLSDKLRGATKPQPQTGKLLPPHEPPAPEASLGGAQVQKTEPMAASA